MSAAAADDDALFIAARQGDLEGMERMVLILGVDPNTRSSEHSLTPLHVASLHGHLDIVQFLVDQGANLDVLDSWRCSPLHNAAGAGHSDIVHVLCDAGARLDIRCGNKVVHGLHFYLLSCRLFCELLEKVRSARKQLFFSKT